MSTVCVLRADNIQDEIDAVIRKTDLNMEKFVHAFPHMSRSGIYSGSLNSDGSWTGSFWTGMVLLAYWFTGKDKYLNYAREYMPLYQRRLEYGLKDHDLGFLFQLYSAALYRFTGDEAAKELTVKAGEELWKRYNPKGRFLRAWGNPEEEYRRGVMIIDCLMNLPLLHTVARITGDAKYYSAADSHANTTMTYNIRKDYSSYHTYEFNPDTGQPIGGFNEGGYSDESAWARGQAWGIYGFALAYRNTGREDYLAAAQHMAGYFIQELPEDRIPYWDFKLPDYTGTYRDASAAAIAASGLLEIADAAKDPAISGPYREAACRIAGSLMTRYSASKDDSIEGIVRNCFARDPDKNEGHFFTIWGDYYYMELLLKLAGPNPRMWSL